VYAKKAAIMENLNAQTYKKDKQTKTHRN